MTLCTLNILDILTTLYALARGAVEMNPILAPVIAAHPLLFVGLKLSVLPLCRWLRDKRSYTWVCAVYALVVWNNLYIGFYGLP